MAQVGALNFRAFVDHLPYGADDREQPRTRAYAYVSDKHTRSAFARAKPVEDAIIAAVRIFKAMGKGQMLGHAVKVGPRQFPRVYSLLERCAKTLDIATPALYIQNSPFINAMTYGTNDDSFIIVHSALIDHMTDEELLSVLGHECGHIHNDHVVYLTALHYLLTIASTLGEWVVRPAMLALSGWQRRAEITCDRAGLLCAGDLDVAQRALAKVALGSTKLYDEMNVEAFMEQAEESREGIGRYAEITAHHPWLPKRLVAMKAFSESELFRKHVGLDGGLSMEEVDEKVHEIIKVWG